MKWLFGAVNAVCLIVILLFTSIELFTFSKSFYSKEYDKYDISKSISVEKDDLMVVTNKLLDYMRDEEKDLVVFTRVNGENREFFSEREKEHMVDVKNLFMLGYTMRYTALLLFAATALVLAYKRQLLKVIPRCYVYVTGAFLAFALVVFLLIALDFDRAFDIFHELFFANDLWQLDPSVDLLVNIVPLGFFMDISARVGILFAAAMVVVVGSSTAAWMWDKHRDKEKKHDLCDIANT